ncbi:hypothetical protein ACLB2K_032720 [Fragaria x ananassa]
MQDFVLRSPSGKLVQIEHALTTVGSGQTSLGIKGNVAAPGFYLKLVRARVYRLCDLMGKLSNLQYVDLSFNNLSGALPKQLANLPNIVSFNISHNNLQGELPSGGFFNTISPSSVSANPSLCGSAVNKSCPAVLPKPIVLNPNSTSDSITGALPSKFGHKRIILSISALIAIGAAAFIVIGVIAITVLNLRVRISTSRPPAAVNIILGTAKSLAHLHQMNIIHYNIKSSNVLISDSEFACKTVKITEKCDVYGFGVLVLEVVTGKRPIEYMEDDVEVLCDMVRGALEEGRVEECIDARLQESFPAEEAIPVMKLGLICTSQVPSNRPDMGEVVNILELIRCPSEGQDESG